MTEPATGSTPAGATSSGLRGRLVSRSTTFGCLLLGCLLAVVATAQPWWRASTGATSVAFKGTEATGGLSQALALVVSAGTLLVLVLNVRGRRLLAVLLAVAGAGVLLVGALRMRPSSTAVQTKLAEVSLIDQYALAPTAWPWVFSAAGLGVLVGALALMVCAPRWPVSASRFERERVGRLTPAADDSAGIWRALDAGLDPTESSDGGDTTEQADPNVQSEDPGDTMVAKNRKKAPRPASHLSDGRQRHGPSASGRPTSTPE